ncbi:MMS19 nucleotide excision repair protein homolog isoform X1 [Erpetoichthys calabaricus]|uniref:MMS19 nucleotide excision repair protein n=1 Tax=Erpetoichthys calabaricus TaxID=27687 RepID=A0A8C4RFR9_ERPCA|nr:MMS19 nucleotide excision repair protein homolog isoform X1 [Erpetoichthys calabaricus]
MCDLRSKAPRMHAMAGDGLELLSLVEEFVVGQQDSKAEDIATGVTTGQFTILKLVEGLGSVLTSCEPRTRGRGVQLLSSVIQQCYANLQEQEVQVLTKFYENRLKDHYIITPHVLQGLKSLTMSPALPSGLAVSILGSLFQDIHVQSLMQAERFCVYSILLNLMGSCEGELKGLGANFVFGFIQAMDGEKDPRNLLLSFQIAQNIINRKYELGTFTEELFEVTSCYFPIDFNPPPNDPHGITQKDLVLSLRAVLSGTPQFAEFLLPLLIEKLDSDIQSAKLDALQTLTACVASYGHKELKEFLPSLWSSIRREVFQTASEKVESAGLSALHGLTACLSRSVLTCDSEDSLETFLNLIVKDCQHHLCEPDLKLVWPSAKLLQAAASSSFRASCKISRVVVPLLLEQYNHHVQSTQRRTLLEVLQKFIHSAKRSPVEEGGESSLAEYRQSLCSVVFCALSDSSSALQTSGLRTLMAIGNHPGLLFGTDIELAVDHLSKFILEDVDNETSLVAMEASGSLACLHTTAFCSRMVPALKEKILSDCLGGSGETPPAKSQQALFLRIVRALAAISTHPNLVRETVPILLQVLSASHTGNVQIRQEDVISVCQNLQCIVELAQGSEESACYFHETVIPYVLGLSLQAAFHKERTLSPLREEKVLSALVPVFSAASGCSQHMLAAQTASQILMLFLVGDATFLPENNVPQNVNLLKSHSDNSAQTQLVCLLMGCVCSLPINAELPMLDQLLTELEELSCTCLHPFTYTSAAKCFAGLVNKYPSGQKLDQLLENTLTRIDTILTSTEPSSSSNQKQAFTFLLWLTKALLLRYHPLSAPLTDKLLCLLVDPSLGTLAADGFALLMNDPPDVLNKACHADVRMMYRQRFFTETAPKLVQGFNSSPKEMKSSYLKALSHILNCLPKQVLISELPALLPLLLEGVSCPDSEVQLSTLSCLHPLLLDIPQVLTLHLETLITKLLGLTSSAAMKIRIMSLRCLHALTQLPLHVILPFRSRTLRALAVPLDDKKRLVRKEAVLARGEWFLLGGPGK